MRIFYLLLYLYILSANTIFGQQICRDTTSRTILYLENDSSFTLQNAYRYNSLSNLLLGSVFKNDDQFFSSIIKTNNQNKPVWSKAISNLNVYIQSIVVLADGKICAVVSVREIGWFNRYLLFLDTNGNIISCNDIRFDVPNPAIDDLSAYPTQDGKLILIARFDNNNLPEGGTQQWFAVAKYNTSGVVEWSHAYQSCGNKYGKSGCAITNSSFFIWSGVSGKQQDGTHIIGIQLFKFDLQTGSLLKSKTCGISLGFNTFASSPGSPYTLNSFFNKHTHEITCFLPTAYYYTDTNHIFFKFDTALNVLASKYINYTGKKELMYTGTTFNSNGNLFITNAKQLNNKFIEVFHIDKQFGIVEQKAYFFSSNITGNFPFWNYNGPQIVLNDHSYSIYNNVIQGRQFQIEIAESNFNAVETNCNGKNIDSITINDFKFIDGNIIFTYEKSNITRVKPASLKLFDINIKSGRSCFFETERKFDCGNDITLCKGDSIQIKAPANFLNYTWPVTYNMRTVSDSSILIHPEKDTFYIAQAETGSGCVLSDTIFVKIKNTRAINLGKDTSICKGDSIVLNTDADFNNYQWSTGETKQAIVIKLPGLYFVNAQNKNGCYSFDTIIIKQILSPSIHLRKDAHLCINQTDTLKIDGDFINYKWQDGSVKPYIKVTAPATYTLKVTASNGCTASDSVIIKTLENTPVGFLFTDTSICSYERIELKPKQQDYISYLWNNGSTQPFLQIDKPGKYSLSVTTKNGCIGQETINVKSKICINKISFPNAFTPDNNGLNDIFKPIIEGNIFLYELTIYNKWGTCIFKTKDSHIGWNGYYKGVLQPLDTYIWNCKIQFFGDILQYKKGLLLLLF